MRQKKAKAKELSAWGKEIQKFLEASNKPDAMVIRKLGCAKSTFHKCLRSKMPEQATVQKVNRAVAAVIGIPSIEKCLAVVEADERLGKGGLVTVEELQSAMEDFADEKGAFENYLRPGYEEQITDFLLKSWETDKGKKTVLTLILAVQKATRRNSLRYLHGETQKKPRFDEMMDVLQKYGIDLRQWMKPESELRIRRTQDAFFFNLMDAIAKKGDDGEPLLDAGTRHKIEHSISSAFREYVHVRNAVESEKRISLIEENLEVQQERCNMIETLRPIASSVARGE